MNYAEDSAGPAVGLDLGTSRIVVARGREQKCSCEAQLNAFITVPHTRLTAALLAQENVFHFPQGPDLVVAGSDAQKFAEVFHVELRRPMVHGLLNPQEPHSLAVVRQILTRLVGTAAREKQRLAFSIPAPPAGGGDTALAYHEASVRRILTELGYDCRPVEEGLAVVYGELALTNYTGIAISFGGGLSNVCLAVLSLPVWSFSLPKAGDFIDAHTALATGERAARIRVQKEQAFQFNGFTADRVYNALSVYFEEVMQSVAEELARACARHLPRLDQAIPVVLSGGSALPGGFLDRFRGVLESADLPVPISEVQLAPEPLWSTAKGALVAASL